MIMEIECKKGKCDLIDKALELFGKIYSFYYDNEDELGIPMYDPQYCDEEFRYRLRADDMFKAFIKNTINKRGDVFTSDREVASILKTYEIMQIGYFEEMEEMVGK